MMKQKKMKSTSHLSSEDISSLTIFKSVVSEAGALRNQNTKLKLHELNFSKLMAKNKKDSSVNPQKGKETGNTRRSVLSELMEMKIGEGGEIKLKEFRPAEEK